MISDAEQLTVGTTEKKFTTATIRPTDDRPMYRAYVHVNSGVIRARWDGTSPTSSTGVLCGPGSDLSISGLNELINFGAISADGVDAEIFVHYGKGGMDV